MVRLRVLRTASMEQMDAAFRQLGQGRTFEDVVASAATDEQDRMRKGIQDSFRSRTVHLSGSLHRDSKPDSSTAHSAIHPVMCTCNCLRRGMRAALRIPLVQAALPRRAKRCGV